MDDDDEEVITTKADTILNSDTITSQKNKTTGPRPRNLHAMLVKRDRTVVSNKYLVNKNQNYNLRNNSHSKYHIKSANVDSFKFSFFSRTIKEWNDLSEKEVSCLIDHTFRAALQQKI